MLAPADTLRIYIYNMCFFVVMELSTSGSPYSVSLRRTSKVSLSKKVCPSFLFYFFLMAMASNLEAMANLIAMASNLKASIQLIILQ